MFLLVAFFLAYLVQSLGEGLHDMEPVDRDLGLGKVLGQPAEEGWRHVSDDIDHIVRIAAMARQEGAESLDDVLAAAWDCEDHRFLLALHVEEHCDLAMTAPGGGFIDANSHHIRQIQLPQHATHVVMHDAH